MTCLVTGATGHVGPNLVRALIQEGRNVRALAIGPKEPALANLDVEYLEVDVRDEDRLNIAFLGAEVVYHLAALISVTGPQGGKVFDINVSGTRNVVQAALKAGVRRLVYFGSIHAFQQEPLDEPLDETRALVGENGFAYDRSKVLGQMEVLQAVRNGLDAVIVYPSAVLGPSDYTPSRVGRLLIELFQGQQPASVEGGCDWVDVRDVVLGAIAAEEWGRTGECYILSGQYKSLADLLEMASQVSGAAGPTFAWPQWVARLGIPFAWTVSHLAHSEQFLTSDALSVLRANSHIVHDKATRELGYRVRPLETTLRDTYAWFLEQGYIKQLAPSLRSG